MYGPFFFLEMLSWHSIHNTFKTIKLTYTKSTLSNTKYECTLHSVLTVIGHYRPLMSSSPTISLIALSPILMLPLFLIVTDILYLYILLLLTRYRIRLLLCEYRKPLPEDVVPLRDTNTLGVIDRSLSLH